MAPPDCSPLADLNGRTRAGLVTPSKPTVANGDNESWTISAVDATKLRAKLFVELPEQRRRATAAEEKVASQEKLIQQLQNALEGRSGVNGLGGIKERKRLPEQKEEKTLELGALRVELHQAQTLLEVKDATIERLMPAVVASRTQDSQQVRNKDVEIERLRQELDGSRAEVAQLKPVLREVQQRLELKEASRTQDSQQVRNKEAEIEHLRHELDSSRAEVAQLKPDLREVQQRLDSTAQALELKEAELERLLPDLVTRHVRSSYTFHSKDAELTEVRRELESTRAELVDKKQELQQARSKHLELQQARGQHLELQQARQELEFKNGEIDQIRRELFSARTELASKHQETQQGRGKNLELQQARQDLELKNSENDRLRRELDASRAECSHHLLELQRLRNASFRGGDARSERNDYEQVLSAQLSQEEQQLSMRRMDLERREQAVAKSEGLLMHSRIEPVVLPMRSPPVSRAPTPRRIPTVSRAPTPPVSPRQQFHGGGGSGIPYRPGGGLWGTLGF